MGTGVRPWRGRCGSKLKNEQGPGDTRIPAEMALPTAAPSSAPSWIQQSSSLASYRAAPGVSAVSRVREVTSTKRLALCRAWWVYRVIAVPGNTLHVLLLGYPQLGANGTLKGQRWGGSGCTKECPEASSTRWVRWGCPRNTGNPALSAPSHVTTSPNTREPLEGARKASVAACCPPGSLWTSRRPESPGAAVSRSKSVMHLPQPCAKTPVHLG